MNPQFGSGLPDLLFEPVTERIDQSRKFNL
jgi:phage baseplate assembly protein W